ncbi:MAG: hypothetical protein K0R57_5507 [Paenibacillaceae bacterium]|jgi:hypothetical protein|nr:hypothetical protein [Paenibacillaceae bacterium]
MSGILDGLYAGKIVPEELIRPRDPEYSSINKKIVAMMGACRTKFSEEDFKLVEDMLDLLAESNSMESKASFSQGFKLGGLIMLEVLAAKEEFVGE